MPAITELVIRFRMQPIRGGLNFNTEECEGQSEKLLENDIVCDLVAN